MTGHSFSCQCRKSRDWPCEAPMTQEDLLCDTCCDGCNIATMTAGGTVIHIRFIPAATT